MSTAPIVPREKVGKVDFADYVKALTNNAEVIDKLATERDAWKDVAEDLYLAVVFYQDSCPNAIAEGKRRAGEAIKKYLAHAEGPHPDDEESSLPE